MALTRKVQKEAEERTAKGTKQMGLQTPPIPNQGSSAFVSFFTELLSMGTLWRRDLMWGSLGA